MRKRKSFKGVATLLILVFLLNFTFIPSGYASDLSGLDKAYAGQSTYSQITALPLVEPTKNVASGVYSNQTDQAVVHKEIEFPALPNSTLLPGKQGTQSDGVFMKHVINMPKIDEKPVPYIPIDNRVQNGQNPGLRVDGPSIAGFVNGSIISSSPNSLIFEKFNEMTFDEADLNLVDDDAAENPFQALLSHIDSIPNNAAGSVTDSMYNNVTYEMYNDGGGSGYDLPPVQTDSKQQNSVVSSVYSVSDSANNPFPIHNKAGRFSARFPRKAGSELFQFSFQNANITLGPITPASVPGFVDKNRILYEEIHPSTDIRYTVEQSQLKEELIVKKYTGQKDFFFNIDVKNAVYKVSSDTTILFYDPASGQPLFYIPKGFAIDGNGNRCDAVSLEFTEEGLLKLSVEADWLQNAAYPVTIDPTICLFDATFARPSVAYKQDGTQVASGMPRYEAGKFDQGIMVEEGTINLATDSNWRSSATNMIPEGTTLPVVSYDGTNTFDPGTGSGKIVWQAGSAVWDPDISFSNTWVVIPNGEIRTFSLYAKAQNPFSVRMYVTGDYGFDYTTMNLTTQWQRYTYTVTNNTGSGKYVGIYLALPSTGGTMWVDNVQIEAKSYATTWQIDGTPRSSESLTIPAAGMPSATGGTWEQMVYVPSVMNKGDVGTIMHIPGTSGSVSSGIRLHYRTAGTWELRTYADDGTYSNGTTPVSVTSPGWHRFSIKWNAAEAKVFIDGVLRISLTNPKLPSRFYSSAYVGSLAGGYSLNTIHDDITISSIARPDAEMQARGTSSSPLSIDASTICKFNFDGNLSAYPTINTFNATFSRSSIAYKQDGTQVASSSLRYEAGKFNKGIMVEEGTTNLATDSNWRSSAVNMISQGTTPPIVSYDGTNSYDSGTGSGKIVWQAGSVAWDPNLYLLNSCVTIPDGETRTFSLYAKAQNSFSVRMYITGDYGFNYTTMNLTTQWQRYIVTVTNNTGSGKYVGIYLALPSTSGTMWVDNVQIEAKSYATTWQIDGTPRSSENLTIPTAGVLNPSQGTIEAWAYIDPNMVHSANNTNWPMIFSVVTLGSPYSELNQISIRKIPSSTTWVVEISNSSGAIGNISLGNITTPGWYFFGVKWQQGVGGYAYLNGVLKGSVTASYLPSSFNSTAYIGGWLGYYHFDNIIDDLRISSIARADSDILADYQSSKSLPTDTFTTCKLSFDDTTGGYSSIQSGSGIEPYWNYTSTGLGGGWQAAVNTWNLNLILSKPLFLVPGRGMPIGESITYNSNLGGTWTFGNNTRVVESPDGSVTYNKSDGGSYTFTPNGSGGYIAPPGVYLTLQKNGTGDFTILDKHKNTYKYLNGKPNQFKDRNDNATNFSYDPSTGRLDSVSDPSGRKLTYAYNVNGQVDSITDPANRAYQFGYQNGYLTTVTDPDNNTYTLGYDANGRVATLTDPLNRVTTFVCTPAGQITGLRDARTNGQDVYETSFTQTLEGSSIIVKVTDPGNKTSTFYHDNNTGNLTKFQDGLGNTWQYVWENNNLKQVQDAKGQTTYQYDSRGNVTSETTTVDANSANNITKTMTYDDNNQLLEVTDGNGRKTSYKYSNKGELLSTSDPGLKESNGRKYDLNGNVLEYSPGVSSSHNQVINGSMEIPGTGGDLLSGWTRVPGTASTSLEGFNSHGNSALKMTSNTPTTDLFKQTVYASSSYPHRNLTLRADIKLANVQQSNPDGGAIIRLDYGFGNYEEWYCWGTGTVPISAISRAARDNVVTVQIGIRNASGTAWFDGVQLENAFDTSQGYILSSFSSIENGGFEGGGYWSYNGATTTYATEEAWESLRSFKVNLATNGVETFSQDVPVYGGEPLTFSGMVKASNISGTGAYYKVDYYDASNNLITGATVQTGYVTGIQDWARLTAIATAPANAHHARVQGILDGSGTAYFDVVKLIPLNTQKYTYDTTGNYVNTSKDASGKQQSYTYNQNTGNMLTFTDALNHTTTFSYDNLNRLFQVTDPLTKNSYYDYDSVSNLVYSRDPRSASSSDNTYRSFYGPDNLNRLSNLTDPLNRNAAYIYDRSGNLIQVLLPNGLQQDFTYDAANRLVKTTLDGGKYFSYTYDGANELTGVTDQDNNTYSWNYDGAHRLKISTDTDGYSLHYGWDKSSNLTSLVGSDYNYNLNYYYGSANQLIYMILPDNSAIFYDSDENGRVFQIRYPWANVNNKRVINYAPNGWVTKIQDPSFPGNYSYNYYYNDNGTISGYGSWAGMDSFNYDANGRLTYWNYSPMGGGGNTQENYTYDAAGNLLTKGSRTFTYNSANQITNAGCTYDANGNMTGDGTYIYTYNALNQLTQVKRAYDNAVIASYAYNHNGLRKSKTVNGVITTYNWDASGNLVRETTAGASTYFYYVGGKLVGLKKNNTTYIVHDNLRGDVDSVTDVNGNIVAQAHYDPLGNRITSSGSLVQPFRYAGYYYDDETGLYYLKSRYYSPVLGRFFTRDGIKYIKYTDQQTLNLYSYCLNNPVSNSDPTGQSTTAIGERLSSFAATLATLAIVMGVQAYLQKMDEEIEKLKQRVEGPQGEQYSLRATHSGEYTNVRGGTIHLEAGDVWKYGETTNPSDRYSDKWLTENGLYYYTEFAGTQLQCKIIEKEKIYGYFITNWSLPPGNKIFR